MWTRFESAPSSPLSTGSIPRSNKLKLREPHEVLPVGRTSSVTRLPAHFIPSPGSGSNTRPSVNRTHSLRNPTSPCSTDITSVEAAVDYLRSTLPRQPSRSNLVGRRMYGEPGSTNIGDMRDRSNLRTPFGLKR
ncbi:uncharacterized protein LOC111716466 isoform X2 [Eurytemora carolleeae]|uniref:uncharacterized protein LOC111716466 isoform X2 n=1 Tax=Eurytemora carolleeae TaxID=1294199 RepID=UPI000C76FC89|nr:uncharacterized protein LOC111716466 isoform X2 [Eurytemora carolleeae]|eukprot:XP_023347691.1 uncharacterized protein LOC111716466 isoform X2 [Eurytemora affinis]